MPWRARDDAVYDAPCIQSGGTLATALWDRSVNYCARNGTDGFLPASMVRTLADWHGIYEDATDGRLVASQERVDPLTLAQRLIAAGLWERVDGGYRVRDVQDGRPIDYLDTQPSAKEVRRERRARSRQRAAAGRASATKRQRDGNGSGNELPTGAQRDG